MKETIRHITSILFLLVGFIPILLFFVFLVAQQSIRKEMKEKMETEQLRTIVLADNEIHWAKADKEIWIDGKMFDIKSSESKGGLTIFKGLFDNEETLLKQNLKKNWEKNQTEQNQLFTQLFQTLQNIYFINSDGGFTEQINKLENNSFAFPIIPSQFLEIPTPPPLS